MLKAPTKQVLRYVTNSVFSVSFLFVPASPSCFGFLVFLHTYSRDTGKLWWRVDNTSHWDLLERKRKNKKVGYHSMIQKMRLGRPRFLLSALVDRSKSYCLALYRGQNTSNSSNMTTTTDKATTYTYQGRTYTIPATTCSAFLSYPNPLDLTDTDRAQFCPVVRFPTPPTVLDLTTPNQVNKR